MAIAFAFALQFAQDACATLTALRPLFPPTSVPSIASPRGSAKSLPMLHSGFANARGRDKERDAPLLVRRTMGSEQKASVAIASASPNSMAALLVSDALRLRQLLGVGHVSASTRPTAARPNPPVERDRLQAALRLLAGTLRGFAASAAPHLRR